MVKKAAGRRQPPHKRRRGWGTVLAPCLALSLASAGTALALWGPGRDASPGHPAAPKAAAAVAPAPLQSQNSFPPSVPSKEYVYAGTRLVATEEPAAPGPSPTPTPTPTPTPPPLLDQTIIFQRPSDKTYGDPPFALTASSSSGLPVSFAVESGPAMLSGNVLTLTGAGQVRVRAEQPGGSGYNPAAPVTLSFKVAKAAATLTLGNTAGKVYDGTPKLVTVTTSPPALSGVSVFYSKYIFPPSWSATPPTQAGQYQVEAKLDNPNYAARSAAADFQIFKATPVVTWPNPADIAEGAPLGPAQLNATADAPGSFTYTPPAGTVLGVGDAQQLSAAFTPADGVNYNGAAASARVNVIACPRTQGSSFDSARDLIGEGASTTLAWNVPNARSVSVSGVPGAIGAVGRITVTPAATTTYTLTAGAGPCPAVGLQKTVTVVPCPKESATSFTADSTLLAVGGSVRLSWSAPAGHGVEISTPVVCPPTMLGASIGGGWTGLFGLWPVGFCRDGRRQIMSSHDAAGSITLTPDNTATYFLTVTGGAYGCPVVEKQLKVEVIPAPGNCSPGAFFGRGDWSSVAGDYFDEGVTTLVWSVPNAAGVTITDDTGASLGTLGPMGRVWVDNRRTRTYTLTAQIAHGASCSPYVLTATVECIWNCYEDLPMY